MVQYEEIACAYSACKPAIRLVLIVAVFYGLAYVVSEPVSGSALWSMIEEHVDLFLLASTVYVYENGAFVAFSVFPVQVVNGFAPLSQTPFVVAWNGFTHASLAFAVWQKLVVSYAVFAVLYNHVHFGAVLHEPACQSKRYVVGIFVLV